MKTILAIALALGLGVAATGFALDGTSQNSKKALVTYGKMELKEKNIERAIASEEKAAPEKKATVAVTRDTGISGDRDFGAAEPVSAHSSKGNGLTFK